jgi:acetoin utilization deacetylase AcuC-like enzyme
MHAYYVDHIELPLPSGHRFPASKYRLLREQVALHLPQVQLQRTPLAVDNAALVRVHTQAYIEAVDGGLLSAAAQRDIGFPWSPGMAERARRSVSATVAASLQALGDGMAGSLGGGTHHAYADQGGGFCVFNDVAVAARLVQAQWRQQPARTKAWSWVRQGGALPLQVAVIDLDVHQGNGTARIFAGDDSVFTLSLHGARNFPFQKERSDLDVELPDGCSDADYLTAVDHALATLEQCFTPDLVFYLAGADPHEGDRLGRLAVSHDGLEARDRRVMDWAWQRRLPLVLTMAGGYGRNLDDTLRAQLNTWRVASGYHQRYQRHWQNGQS